MKITERGLYQTTRDIQVRNLTTVGVLPAGAVINVTQIDAEYHKVFSPDLLDWVFWDLPVISIDPATTVDTAADTV